MSGVCLIPLSDALDGSYCSIQLCPFWFSASGSGLAYIHDHHRTSLCLYALTYLHHNPGSIQLSAYASPVSTHADSDQKKTPNRADWALFKFMTTNLRWALSVPSTQTGMFWSIPRDEPIPIPLSWVTTSCLLITLQITNTSSLTLTIFPPSRWLRFLLHWQCRNSHHIAFKALAHI